MSGIKRHTFTTADLVRVEVSQRWWVCPTCRGVLDFGQHPPASSRAPRCTLCSSFCAPCTPDEDLRS